MQPEDHVARLNAVLDAFAASTDSLLASLDALLKRLEAIETRDHDSPPKWEVQ